MTKRDHRSKVDKAQWKKGEFTAKDAKDMGMTKAEANKARAEQERELGNELAPPE